VLPPGTVDVKVKVKVNLHGIVKRSSIVLVVMAVLDLVLNRT